MPAYYFYLLYGFLNTTSLVESYSQNFSLLIHELLFCLCFSQLAQRYKSKIVLSVTEEKKQQIKNSLAANNDAFEWIEENQSNSSLEEVCENQKVDLLVVDEKQKNGELDILSILQGGTRIISLIDFWERYLERIPPEEVDQSWLARVDLRMKNPFVHCMKRITDLTIAIFGLLLFSPVLLVALLAIGFESGFPLFFSQKRTGYLGKTYSMIKLRTMRQDAEGEGAQWAQKEDSRITFFGKFLRNWRIDEIPQFWNVIKGEMSVVGPRPERPEFLDKLCKEVPHWNSRNLLKPGLTGWAQIRFSYASDVNESEEKLAFYLYNLKNASMVLDIEIILSTQDHRREADEKVLVTGGAGYIGSHTVLALLESGREVVVIDNFSNSSPESIRRISKISSSNPKLIEGDINDRKIPRRIFTENLNISSVIHFAALKAVGEPTQQPLNYY